MKQQIYLRVKVYKRGSNDIDIYCQDPEQHSKGFNCRFLF